MRKFIGVLVLFLVASGFVMAQAAVPSGTVTSANCTIEWVQVSGKASVRLTNTTDKAQTIQYTIAGKEPASIDVPAKTVVTLAPYTGANANGVFAIAKVTVVAKPKALPKDATSAAIAAAAAPAAVAPATTPAAPATTTPKK